MPRPRSTYTAEFKLSAVKMITEQKLSVAEQNLKGIIPDAILVRISVVSQDGEAARLMINEFVQTLIASVPASTRAVFIA